MAVPKKRISSSKKRIRKNIWKGQGSGAALKAFSVAKSLSTGNSKSLQLEKNMKNKQKKPFSTSFIKRPPPFFKAKGKE
uniref:Large ribosomal subunit protein bL32c n=1 Tax=Erodium trifolium TaxID=337410 RepID=A0A075CAA3_9ROSI|nr:ribosomal protein L32 [Erodium trifolium]AGY60990.1 ribosomal protein L32 [Erodium trifolium]